MKKYSKIIIPVIFYYLVVITICMFVKVDTRAVTSYQGSGTASNPFIVSNEQELYTVLQNYNSEGVYIELDSDMTLSTNYVPTTFKASFDGNFHKITASTQFFTTNSGTLKNFYYIDTVERYNVVGSSTAGIVCDVNNGTISGVIATGDIDCSCSHSSNDEKDFSRASRAGIIAGDGSGLIVNCAAFGSVSVHCKYGSEGSGISVGCTVKNSYCNVSVSATGSSRYGESKSHPISLGSVTNSYFVSSSSTNTQALTEEEMKTTDFVESLNSISANTDSEWTFDTNNKNNGYPILKEALNCSITSNKQNIIFSSSNTIQLSCTDSYASLYYTVDGSTPTLSSSRYSGSITIYDDTVLKVAAYKNGLWSSVTVFHYSKVVGLGTKENPYIISSESSFYSMKELGNDKYYKFTNDITLSSELFTITNFYGVIDGNGKSVNNIYSSRTIGSFITNNYGLIQNLTFNVGEKQKLYSRSGFVNSNYGVVYNCHFNGCLDYISASETNGYEHGGIVAVNEGLVEQCSFTGSLLSPIASHVGGIVGLNYGDVRYCNFNGFIDIYTACFTIKQAYVGGIVGYNSSYADFYVARNGDISYCTATGPYIKANAYLYSGVIVGSICGNYLPSNSFCIDNIENLYCDSIYLEWGTVGTNRYQQVEGLVIPEPHNHTFNFSHRDPICNEYHKVDYTCSCGFTYITAFYDEITGKYHNYTNSESTVIVAPTCISVGQKSTPCIYCSYELIEEMPVVTHTGMGNDILVDSSLYPESSHNYSNNLNNIQEFTHPNAQQISVTFSSSTKVESNYDKIYIYDGNNNQIGVYTGVELANQTIIIPGNKFSIKLTSDYSVSYYGYSIDSIYVTEDIVNEDIYIITIIKEASCTEDGIGNKYCTICDVTQEIVIPALDHDYIVDSINESCTEEGTKTYTCTRCNDSYDEKLLPMGHNYYSYVSVEPTCTSEGIRTYTCIRCNDTYDVVLEKENHLYTTIEGYDATCTEDGVTDTIYCVECNYYLLYQEIIPAYGHCYELFDTQLPTCEEKGHNSYDCYRCGDYYSEEIPALWHADAYSIEVQPTCTENGYYGTYCPQCDEYIDLTDIPALGHDIVIDYGYEPTCNTPGLTEGTHCLRCDYVIAQEFISELGHIFDTVIIDATCDYEGYTIDTCVRCNEVYNHSYIPAMGHNFADEWTYIDYPTETMTGLKGQICLNGCGMYINLEEIPVLPYSDGLTYELNEDCTGYIVVHAEALSNKINITPYYNGMPVVGIDSYAFSELNIQELIIPNTVTTISSNAIYNCDELVNLYLPNSIKYAGESAFYSSIDSVYYDGNIYDWLNISFESYSSNPMRYGESFYMKNDNLEYEYITEIVIPGSCRVIGKNQFYGFNQLTSIVISEGVEIIDDAAFYDCDGIASIVIPNSVTTIGTSAFCDCSLLLDVEFGHNVEIIRDRAFDSCTSLEEIVLPDKVTYLEYMTFGCCYNLINVVLNENINEIANYAFYNCHSLKELRIPDGVYKIREYATYGCSELDMIIIPSSVEVISNYAIYGSNDLVVMCEVSSKPSGWKLNWTSSTNIIWNYLNNHNCTNNLIDVVNPTCTEQGYKVYYCSICEETYFGDFVAELGHQLITIPGFDATCNGSGFTASVHCERCNYRVNSEEIPMLGHDYEVVTTAPTCVSNGYTTYTCNRCNHSYDSNVTAALGHDIIVDEGIDASCTNEGLTEGSHCTRCSYKIEQEIIPAFGHLYVNKVVNATCITDGYTAHTCDRCNHSYKDSYVVAYGHNMVEDEAVEVTCTTDGLTSGSHCTRCAHMVAQQVIPALGHSYIDVVTNPTCLEDGYTTHTCERCNYEYIDSHVSRLEHIFDQVIIKPTCETEGSTTNTCYRCGYSYVLGTASALGHDIVILTGCGATCTENGLTWGSYCSRCSFIYPQSIIPALGHVYEDVVTNATCISEGYTTHTCIRCNDSYIDSHVESLGHDIVIDKGINATCTETGLTEGSHCTRCNYKVVQEVIEALGHTFSEWIIVSEPTFEQSGIKYHTCDICGYEETVEYNLASNPDYFKSMINKLSNEGSYKLRYIDLYNALRLYSLLSDEQKEEVAEEFNILQSFISQYNSEVNVENSEMESAIKTSFIPLTISYVFLAGLFILLKRKYF